jgi:radical SAM superfamily enzyme YgiQ (UPF0313 family)
MWQCLHNPNNESKDMVIVTVPWTDSSLPLMAPAALKPIVEKAGLSCLAVDLNVEIYQFTRTHAYKDQLIRFFFDEAIDHQTGPILEQLFETTARQIMSWQPKFVGLSLLSYVCQHAAKWLAYYLKKFDPEVTIIVGGAGCLSTFTGPSEYVDTMLDLKLFDYHVRGDGEHSLFELLKGNHDYHGINSLEWKELDQEELRSLPMPDYSHYHFDLYDKKVLPLIGSRGCVRRCTFCDYIANWKKFQWRTAEDIFDEMLRQSRRYKIYNFKFQDSLTNGNQKEFGRLIELIADHNHNNPTCGFTWSGYYIFREHTAKSEREWSVLSQSGASNLAVGIENVNEHIRYAIGKKFSNLAIDYHFEQAKKYSITLLILNIVGYVNETTADIEYAKQWLIDHVSYKDILYLQWGGTLGIFPNTYLDSNKQSLGIQMIGTQPSLWINPTTGSTPAVRAAWVKELNELSRKLGYRVADNLDNHYLLETLINA